MRKSWQLFYTRSLLLRSFRNFVLSVFEYCSAVWCSAADSHLKLLDKVVRSAGFQAGGILECNLAIRRYVAELCMLFKIKSNPMPSGVTSDALVAHRHSFAPNHCRTQCRRTVCLSRGRFGMFLVTLYLMVWDCRVSRAEPMFSCSHDLLLLFCLIFYLFLPYVKE